MNDLNYQHQYRPDTSDPVKAARRRAWMTSSWLLLSLLILNVTVVLLTVSPFTTMFFIANLINVALALALRQMLTLGRILTLLRCLLGILLAFVALRAQPAWLDAAVEILLYTGIALPILGGPNRIKSWAGAGLFALACLVTGGALLSSLVVAG